MKEGLLKLGLRLLGILLYVGPLLAALSVQGGDFMKAAFDPSQVEKIQQKMENLFQFSENTMVKENSWLGENGGCVTVRFTSTSPFPMRIENFSGWASCPQHRVRLAWFELPQPVEINPGETKRFTLTFTPTLGASLHVLLQHLGVWPETELENARMKIRMLGAEIELALGEYEG
ncbi:MAG: hypothetical protein QXH26_05270 [Candidatus Hadarchaeales archaeon]